MHAATIKVVQFRSKFEIQSKPKQFFWFLSKFKIRCFVRLKFSIFSVSSLWLSQPKSTHFGKNFISITTNNVSQPKKTTKFNHFKSLFNYQVKKMSILFPYGNLHARKVCRVENWNRRLHSKSDESRKTRKENNEQMTLL